MLSGAKVGPYLEHDEATAVCPSCKSKNVEQVFRSVFVKTSRKS